MLKKLFFWNMKTSEKEQHTPGSYARLAKEEEQAKEHLVSHEEMVVLHGIVTGLVADLKEALRAVGIIVDLLKHNVGEQSEGLILERLSSHHLQLLFICVKSMDLQIMLGNDLESRGYVMKRELCCPSSLRKGNASGLYYDPYRVLNQKP